MHTRSPATRVRQEGASLIVLGTLELAAGGGVAALGRNADKYAASPSVEPGSEGHGLSGDGQAVPETSGGGGTVLYIHGGLIAGFALVDIATGIYEVATGRLVESTMPFRR